MPIYSLVIPVFNEEATLPELYRRIDAVSGSLDGEIEMVLVDDGSKDRSLDILRDLNGRDARVRYVSLARNFGHQIAITAGLQFAEGDAVVIMDGDLQHPPEVIPRLIEKWLDGFHVVYGRRATRKHEGMVKRAFAFLFYRVLRLLTEVDIPPDTGDFCLMDRKVVDVLNRLPEKGRYLRGLRVWVGFDQTAVEYDQDARFAGEVKYTFRRSLGLAINGILSFSRVPLRLASYLGLLSAFVGVLMMVTVVYWRVFYQPSSLMNYTTITAATFFLVAVQLLCLGILGEYLGRIYEEVQGRPLFTVKEIGGIPEEPRTKQKSGRAAAR